ncbi:MAG: hypothetical protein DA408_01685 [Bacteroidetes bacterium]|nr:MAG: hypothetical protein DA408_01685 [Bacteroidota bacterium]
MTNHQPTLRDLWPALCRHLLLGTDQQSLGTTLRADLGPLQLDSEEEALVLLEALGLVHLLHKGARVLETAVALPESAIEQPRTPCSWRSVQHLQAILNDHHRPALPEFSRLLHQYQKVLPPTSIPLLLDRCLLQADGWPLLEPILGPRGYWLLRQHPRWSVLAPTPGQVRGWATADAAAQPALLRQFRQLDAAAARESLVLQWPLLLPKVQARLLPALATGLAPADEVFLETALQHSRKEVRLVAAGLLASLPTSLLVQRLWQHAQAALHLVGGQLVIELPEHLPKATQADGIYPTGSKAPGGLKLNWLCQLVARIPFYFWERHWQKTPAEVIGLFVKAPHTLPLLQAVTDSLNRFPYAAGEAALIKWWLLTGQETYWNTPAGRQLLENSTPQLFNQCLVTWLEQFGPLVPAESLPAFWLSRGTQTWEPALTRIIVIGFQEIAQQRQLSDWSLVHYHRLLEAAAYQSDPQLLPAIRDAWFQGTSRFGRWHALVEKLLQTLHFRQEMVRALQAQEG